MRLVTLMMLTCFALCVAACDGQSTTDQSDDCSEDNAADCSTQLDASDTVESQDATDTTGADTRDEGDSTEADTQSDTVTDTDDDTSNPVDTGDDTTPDTGGPGEIPGSCSGPALSDRFAAVPVANASAFGRIHATKGPADGAFVAWPGSGQIVVSQVRADGTEVRRDTVSGDDLYGLAATESKYALLVHRSPDVLALVIAEHDGTVVTDRILIGDVDHSVEGNEWFGSGIRAGRLTRAGDGWAAYYTVRRLWPDGIAHYGDQIRVFEADGTRKNGGWGWGCSHSMEVRIVHNGQRLGPLCASDCYPSKGIHFNHRGGELWSDEQGSNCAGAYDTSLGASVATSDGFWLAFTATDQRDSHDVAIARVTGNSVGDPIWLTEDTVRDSALNAEMYDGQLLVAWNADSASQFVLASDPDGSTSSSPVSIPGARLNGASDFFQYTNGDVGWAQKAQDGSLELARLRHCN